MFTLRQQSVSCDLHNPFMDAVWTRIDEELKRRKKSWAWLAASLSYSRQRVNNWKRRGMPPEEYGPVADVLKKSLDWVVRGAEADEPMLATDGNSSHVVGEPDSARAQYLANSSIAPALGSHSQHISNVVNLISSMLGPLELASRENIGQLLLTLARAPDSKQVADDLTYALTSAVSDPRFPSKRHG